MKRSSGQEDSAVINFFQPFLTDISNKQDSRHTSTSMLKLQGRHRNAFHCFHFQCQQFMKRGDTDRGVISKECAEPTLPLCCQI